MAMGGGRNGAMFNEINVTPLTDVFLVLVVLMIVAAPGRAVSVHKVNPPQCHCGIERLTEKLYVDVSRSGFITVNGQRVNSPDSLSVQEALVRESKGHTDIKLELTSDADALQKHLVAVMDAAEGAGIKRMVVLPMRR